MYMYLYFNIFFKYFLQILYFFYEIIMKKLFINLYNFRYILGVMLFCGKNPNRFLNLYYYQKSKIWMVFIVY